MKYPECLSWLSSYPQIMDHWALFYVGFYYLLTSYYSRPFSADLPSKRYHTRWGGAAWMASVLRWWCRSCRSCWRSWHSCRHWCTRSCPHWRPAPWEKIVSPQWPDPRHRIWKYFNWKTIYQHGFNWNLMSELSTDLSSLPGTQRSPVPATTS